ncbi:hypothetical protein EUGRSUZ_A02515 [Eucalyptus grandis]|uniref:Uncharacterized protein n=2 Tax=Eucalyptus grandis TaxID=71139 RepID=A0ACC3M7K4_EUCGR|nr:hypothetical protein EUGRSUZ_A02515 [Eucalyptus grandis]
MLSCALALGNKTSRTIYSSHITSHPNFWAEPTTNPSPYGTNTAKSYKLKGSISSIPSNSIILILPLKQIQCYVAQLVI